MPTLRIPLHGSMTGRDQYVTRFSFSPQKDQHFKDCVFQVTKNAISDKTSVWTAGRESFEATDIPATASGAGTAVRHWRGYSSSTYVLSAFGNTNSEIFLNDTSLGSVTGICEHIEETTISGVANATFITTGNRAYFYPEGGALTEITDTDFPPKQATPLTITGNFAMMDGYAFIMCTNGQIWHSDVNSLSGWSATSSITAQEYPDLGVGVMRHKNYIVAFSRTSTEFFINGGNATGSVLSRVQNMAMRIGCANEHAMVSVGDSICWVGSTTGQIGVYMLTNGETQKISTTEIDASLALTNFLLCKLNVLHAWGKPYLALQLPGSTTIQYVYDFLTMQWLHWSLAAAMTKSDATSSYGGFGTRCFYVGSTTSKVYLNSNTSVAREIQTMAIDCGTGLKKKLNAIRLIGDRATVSMPVSISWSDDDYANFSSARTIDLSSANPQIRRGDEFRRRAFKLSIPTEDSSDRVVRLEAMEIDYEVLTL